MANPYNFVGFPSLDEINKSKQKMHLKKSHGCIEQELITGEIKCSLTTKSYFSIKALFENLHSKNSATVFIPGSSIKGMIRTIMEVMGFGCGFKISRDYSYPPKSFYHKKDRDYKVGFNVFNCRFPDSKFGENFSNDEDLSDYASCEQRIEYQYQQLSEERRKEITINDFEICPICALFGSTSSVSVSGRVTFEDSKKIAIKLIEKKVARLELPRVYRRSFYFESGSFLPFDPNKNVKKEGSTKTKNLQGGIYKGRKFYLHSQNTEPLEGPQEVYSVPPNEEFKFKIRFTNLSDYELGMLLFALTLDNGMYHKLGYGKPIGLGSVKIEPKQLLKFRSDYYKNFEAVAPVELINNKIDHYINLFKEQSGIMKKNYFNELRLIWSSHGDNLAFPILKWFGNKYNELETVDNFNTNPMGIRDQREFEKKKQEVIQKYHLKFKIETYQQNEKTEDINKKDTISKQRKSDKQAIVTSSAKQTIGELLNHRKNKKEKILTSIVEVTVTKIKGGKVFFEWEDGDGKLNDTGWGLKIGEKTLVEFDKNGAPKKIKR